MKETDFMNILLLAFAIPVATVLLAIVLQKVLKCPLLVAFTFFAVLLIITYAVFDSSFLVYAILYTILAYVTALITKLICCFLTRFNLYSSASNQSTNEPIVLFTNANQVNCCSRNSQNVRITGRCCYRR